MQAVKDKYFLDYSQTKQQLQFNFLQNHKLGDYKKFSTALYLFGNSFPFSKIFWKTFKTNCVFIKICEVKTLKS